MLLAREIALLVAACAARVQGTRTPPALDLFGGAGDNRPRLVSGLTH